uniref:Uncharacterized protein n=1 Tax=viral metagenome TaxID=1070528 RepID=A0A6M3JPI8_9ZZZZ
MLTVKDRPQTTTPSNENISIIKIIFWIMCFLILFGGLNSSETKSPSDHKFELRMDARDALKARLRDPGSLQIIDERSSGNTVRIRYRAKNGFGGYNEETFIWKK